jgi:hypothetical protein
MRGGGGGVGGGGVSGKDGRKRGVSMEEGRKEERTEGSTTSLSPGMMWMYDPVWVCVIGKTLGDHTYTHMHFRRK